MGASRSAPTLPMVHSEVLQPLGTRVICGTSYESNPYKVSEVKESLGIRALHVHPSYGEAVQRGTGQDTQGLLRFVDAFEPVIRHEAAGGELAVLPESGWASRVAHHSRPSEAAGGNSLRLQTPGSMASKPRGRPRSNRSSNKPKQVTHSDWTGEWAIR